MKVYLDNVENFLIEINKKEYKVDVKEICGIDEENLSDEFTKYPSTFAWWATVSTLYSAKRDDLEKQMKILEAEMDTKIRKQLSPTERKSTKEKEIDTQIKMDGRYKLVWDEYLDAKGVCRRLDALIRGLEAKKDMLVQIGARKRKEMELDKFSG